MTDLNNEDILVRHFNLKEIDPITSSILPGAFILSSDDKNNGYRLSANCLRILTEDMKVDPFEFTLACRNNTQHSVLEISISSIYGVQIQGVKLSVIHDSLEDNNAHCLICREPQVPPKSVRNKIRVELAKHSKIFQ